jgi:glycosyltransferase involved in cell wall biosynthesis
MLSVLIPVYNYNVIPFVQDLKKQGDALGKEYEIICMDDCSLPQFKQANRELQNINNVFYFELSSNAGRSKIRNLLALKAKYNFLLFLDCDQQTVSQDFLKKYFQNLKEGGLVCGGRVYDTNAPSDDTFFRWHYGKNRETIPAKERNQNPFRSFLSCNFAIDKAVFESIKFNEKISDYGHEDTLFGIELKRMNIPVIHIDNPLLHEGLEDAQTFLNKSRQALKNLLFLYLQDIPELKEEVRILRWFVAAKKFGLTGVLAFIYKVNLKRWEQNILSKKPSLRIFDLYKLGYFATLFRASQKG